MLSHRVPSLVALVALVAVAGCSTSDAQAPSATSSAQTPTQPARATNVYAQTGVGMETGAATTALPRIYVPNTISHSVSVIDPATNTIVETLPTGAYPEHVIVGYDLKSLWIASTNGNTLTRIDPATGKADAPTQVTDPYNVYFTPDGTSMIVIAERYKRLDFRDVNTLRITKSVPLKCSGANHVDYTADGRFALVSCEFSSQVFRLDLTTKTVTGYLTLRPPGAAADSMPAMRMGRRRRNSMPQDVRLTPDGSAFLVADMMADGVFVVAADSLRQLNFIPTGKGAHGIAVGRGGSPFFIANRGWHTTAGGRMGPGSVSVMDPYTRKVTATWTIPGGGSPDMGNVSADGKTVWFSGRYDNEVYALDTQTGALRARIKVGSGPHGLAVWPLPGRYSLGHTGNMR